MNFEQQLLEYFEVGSGCTSTLMVPPPKTCPGYVQTVHIMGQFHLFTGLIVLIFLAMIVHMIYAVFASGGHD